MQVTINIRVYMHCFSSTDFLRLCALLLRIIYLIFIKYTLIVLIDYFFKNILMSLAYKLHIVQDLSVQVYCIILLNTILIGHNTITLLIKYRVYNRFWIFELKTIYIFFFMSRVHGIHTYLSTWFGTDFEWSFELSSLDRSQYGSGSLWTSATVPGPTILVQSWTTVI